jgi:selenocysteine-specific elongation factor
VPLGVDPIEPGTSGFVQLRLEGPIVAAAGDRFVLRQLAPPDTLGGGTVVDASPRKHGPGEAHVERLAALAGGDPLERLALALVEAPSGLAAAQADAELLGRLRESGRASSLGAGSGALWFSPARLADARRRLAQALRDPGGAPVSREALARHAGIGPTAVALLLDALVAEGEARALGPGYVAAEDAAAGEDPVRAGVLAALVADGLEPRSVDALAAELDADPARLRATLDRLALEDGIVRVKPGLYYDRRAIEEARRHVAETCEREGAVTIARLRDDLGTSRKYAQALLEHFDAERFTRRRGDEHVLRQGR